MTPGRAAAGQVHTPAPVRRQVIVDGTVRVMRRKGMRQTTSRDVAAEAGTSSGLLAHHVESHDHLLVCAVEQVAEQDLDRMRSLLSSQLVAGQTDADRDVLLGWVLDAAAAETGVPLHLLLPPGDAGAAEALVGGDGRV